MFFTIFFRWLTIFALLYVARSQAISQERVPNITPDAAWVFQPIPEVFSQKNLIRFSSSKQAHKLISEIMEVLGLQPRFEVYAGPVGNAAARIESGGKRVIYYSETWIQNALKKDEWKAKTLLAHEIGHHLNNHTLQQLDDRLLQELEADRFAGFVIGRLGGSLSDAHRLYNGLPIAETPTHPGRTVRKEAVSVGWREGATNSNENQKYELKQTESNEPLSTSEESTVAALPSIPVVTDKERLELQSVIDFAHQSRKTIKNATNFDSIDRTAWRAFSADAIPTKLKELLGEYICSVYGIHVPKIPNGEYEVDLFLQGNFRCRIEKLGSAVWFRKYTGMEIVAPIILSNEYITFKSDYDSGIVVPETNFIIQKINGNKLRITKKGTEFPGPDSLNSDFIILRKRKEIE